MGSSTDRISFDTGISEQVQSDIMGIVGRLEGIMGERDRQVSSAMSDFQMDGASDEYQHVERRWKNASDEVHGIINLVKTTLGNNDQTATSTQGRTQTAIANIG